MTRAWIAITVCALLLVPGCLDASTYEDLWSDLEAKEEFEERSLFSETVPFGPSEAADPNEPPSTVPGGLDDVGHAWNTTIRIPDGTKSMAVLFTVNFSSEEAPENPLPVTAPDGDVFIYARGPDGNQSQNITVSKPIKAGFDFTGPTAGDWTIGFEARGQGEIDFRVVGTVRIASSSG